MDLVPGMVTYQWFTPTVPGTYEILCEELCGIGHFAMRGKVVVEEESQFQAWLDGNPTFAETLALPEGNAAAGAASYAVCSACHGQQGEGNVALNAPKLASLEGWYIRRQIQHYQAGIRGADPRDTFGMQMAPMSRTLASDTALANVVAYIQTLPDNPTEATVFGDPEHGRKLFMTCAACHGQDGKGIWSTNAPRLAGASDWYLKRQLMNFRERIRGGHEDDIYGEQMHMMALTLAGEDAIDDLVSYINTLE